MAPSGASPELRGEAHGQPRAAAHHRPPRTHRAPRIKGTARGFPRGLFEWFGFRALLAALALALAGVARLRVGLVLRLVLGGSLRFLTVCLGRLDFVLDLLDVGRRRLLRLGCLRHVKHCRASVVEYRMQVIDTSTASVLVRS